MRFSISGAAVIMEESDVSTEQVRVMQATLEHYHTLTDMERWPMSRVEFDALPEGIRAEYVDGVAVVTPPPRPGHNRVGLRLIRILQDALPTTDVLYERGVVVSPTRTRIPDIAVMAVEDELPWSTQVPILVVEILSPSTRSEDLLRKTDDYRLAGIAQYWIVDREQRTLVVLANAGAAWDTVLTLSDAEPTGSVEVPDLGRVELDLAALLA